MAKKRVMRPRSQAEAGYLGRVAAGIEQNPHLTSKGAKTMLTGVDVKALPPRKRPKP